jgi:hypothetical protein
MSSKHCISLFMLCLALLAACVRMPTFDPVPLTFPKIDRRPKAADYHGFKTYSTPPRYAPDSTDPFQMDLRSTDLSQLDLSQSGADLLFATFDSETTWPVKMPAGFDWQAIMETGKNPGLGIRSLHAQGITGKGVKIAIIDQELLIEHQEYADRVRLYEELSPVSSDASMHAPAVASIAVGKTVGVAPEADLYFINGFSGQCSKTPELYHCLARSIRRILEINQQFPAGQKIRVISISRGYMQGEKGSDDWETAMQEADAAGILVVCSNSALMGLGRAPLSDPDALQSYEPGLFWANYFYDNRMQGEFLFVPMDSRATAAPNGKEAYAFYRSGGMSWAIPYLAGMYALAAQVKPEITPDKFWKTALKTGQTIEIMHAGQTYQLGPILDPAALIKALK